ncbi:SDR family NAD(P)-dependent oxidoreductase [Nocardia jinanensis]|uniref:Oxidoreductase n=1 Tax=Nocardia jinanensis TaxID=382504 RepID=A0A917RH24_9NOCA|nr:SDR family oxidoreductase [Nocardia jinanensis]GGL06359.1 oxidoreductase [Nocardia jinanensis]
MTQRNRRHGAAPGPRAGTTAVVTGGARGFGKAFGTALAGEGAAVVLIDIDAAAVEQTATDIRHSGGSATGFAGDVTDEAAMNAIMGRAAAVHGGIDILINNAGLHSDEYSKPIREMGPAKTRRLFEVNVVGVIACTLAAQPHMVHRAGASIVNIASAAAHLGGTAYGTSKLAVAGLTITFARELGADGIRVNAISPGMIFTDTIRAELPDAVQQRVKAMQFIDTDGAEADVVEAMLYLTSDRARFITGETLRVTGGMASGT